MDHASIEDAYEPFVAALRRGGFKAPADGWPAELVAAHVARNNDLVSDVAEQLVIGLRPSYDNRSAVDESELQALADGLAAWRAWPPPSRRQPDGWFWLSRPSMRRAGSISWPAS